MLSGFTRFRIVSVFLLTSSRSFAFEAPSLEGKLGIEAAVPPQPEDARYTRLYLQSRLGGSMTLGDRRSPQELQYKLGLRGWLTREEQGEDSARLILNPTAQNAQAERIYSIEAELLVERATVEYTYRRLRFRFGQQELSLGELLGPSVIDLANSRDFRQPDEFLKNSLRLPQLMAITEYKNNSYGWQLFLSPRPVGMLLPNKINKIPVEAQFQKHEPEYGGRFSLFLSGLDLKFFVMRHQNRLPIFKAELGPEGPRLVALQHYERSFASTMSYAWEQTVLRTEVIRSQVERIDPQDPSPVQLDQAVLALDYSTPDQWLLVGQLQTVAPYDCLAFAGCSEHQLWGGAQLIKTWEEHSIKTSIYLYRRLDQDTMYHKFELEFDTGFEAQARLAYEAYEGFGQGLDFLNTQDRYLLNLYLPF